MIEENKDMDTTPPQKKRRGRPPKLQGAVRQRVVYLSENEWESARAIGEGNASEGVRVALRLLLEKK